MHELSIAYNLVEIAEAAARDAGAQHIVAIHLRLGLMSGVTRTALLFSYDIATEGTTLAGSRLVIEDIPVIVYCDHCQQESPLDSIQMFTCPRCGHPTADIRQGKELEIAYLEVEDATATA